MSRQKSRAHLILGVGLLPAIMPPVIWAAVIADLLGAELVAVGLLQSCLLISWCVGLLWGRWAFGYYFPATAAIPALGQQNMATPRTEAEELR